MKKKIYIIILMFYIQNSFALTTGNIQIMKVAENLQYLGEKIATDYFLLYTKPNNYLLQNQFTKNIQQLEKNIENIANETQNNVTIILLHFYRIQLLEIKELIPKKITKKNAIELLNASKSFLEGARKIAEEHQYQLSKEEKMLIQYKELIYLIESVSKYYMAFTIGIKDNDQNMKRIVLKVNNNLTKLEKYNYNEKLQKKLLKIQNIWEHTQVFFLDTKGSTFPNLLLTSNSYIKELLNILEQHHESNL